MSINKILIANRGEIAVRIIRACKEMGIKTVAVYSDVDKKEVHVHLADESVCIGGQKSYLNIHSILSAALLKGVDAVHPGFGFLSENAWFAEACKACGIKFIGPDARTISLAADKARAKQVMEDAGIPVIKGVRGVVKSLDEAKQAADCIGYPVMIKAVNGGGGRGIRIAYRENELLSKFNAAKAEAKSVFGDDSLYIEKYIENPRHVEVQILADSYGNVVYLGERECSIQRRNQKILEEAPCSAVDYKLRMKMGEAAVLAAKAVNYLNAGTVEFLLDNNNNFYFIEMNTRIQVEYAVTEMVTGIDIVKQQIRIADGKKLGFNQQDVKINGHAIECRINAEDIRKQFAPCPGEIKIFHLPGGLGVRFDTAIYDGYKVSPFYDSMIGKLIVHGSDRLDAIRKMRRALDEFIIDGVKTNVELHKNILDSKSFINGDINTSFLKNQFGI